jgi:hypothetical protein
MPIYRPVGERLLRKEEIIETLPQLKGDIAEKTLGVPLSIRGGELRPFKPVGENKPLLIEIRHVYTGEYPGTKLGVFTVNDMLITSAIRSIATYNAKPKAINFLKTNVKKSSNLRNPRAAEDGTPVVFYTPALVEPNSILDVEIVFDRFNKDFVDGIGAAFTAAGGIPLFAAYSTHLLAAGAVTKLASKIGERLFDGDPVFSESVELSFARSGSPIPAEGFHLITEEGFDPEREGCIFDLEQGRLINKKEQAEYEGRYPYVVISLDGEKRGEYSEFIPTAASAAVLERFYHIKEGQEQSVDMLMEAIKLYNDLKYKQKADDIMSQLANVAEDHPDYQKLVTKRDAYLSNIITDVFKT